jgi:hypothetical protein
MKIKWIILLTIAPLFLYGANITVYEAGYSQHRDPNVRLTNVVDEIQLKGVYVEHSVYVTFSYDFNSWFFKNYNELELEWSFKAPSNLIMFDLYYWEADSVKRADILDRWTAENMFSEKSSPHREPAIMTMSNPSRDGQTTYTIRMFPIVRGKEQQIMIRYLVPATATSGNVRTWLPVNQLTTSDGGARKLHVVYRYSDNEDEPYLIGEEDAAFEQDAAEQEYSVEFPIYLGDYIELVMPTPIEEKFYLTTFAGEKESFYQLAIYPPELPPDYTPRKMLILIDYNKINSQGIDGELLLSSLKESILSAFTEQDSLAIIAAYDELAFSGESYAACTIDKIDSMFLPIFGKSFWSVNFTQELLQAGAAFVRDNGGGEVLWLTNRNDFSQNWSTSEKYAEMIRNLYPVGTVFHALDLENKKPLVSWEDYGYVAANFPFLRMITHETGGNLFFLRFHPLKTALSALFFDKVTHFDDIEIQARMASGYTYANKLFAPFEGYYPLDFPVIQTGRFNGDLPMSITIIANAGDQQVKEELVIQPDDAQPGSEEVATAYYGAYLQSLNSGWTSNWTISEMIDLSLESRVMTPYTAFLVAAEVDYDQQDDTGQVDDGSDEGGANPDDGRETGVADKHLPEDFSFAAAPNPFNPTTTFRVIAPDGLVGEEMRIDIYNVLGQKVKTIVRTVESAGMLVVAWDATTDDGELLPAGTYFAVMVCGDFQMKIKLAYVK